MLSPSGADKSRRCAAVAATILRSEPALTPDRTNGTAIALVRRREEPSMFRARDDIRPIEKRLVALERRYRRLRFATVAAAVMGALALLAPYSNIVRRALPSSRIVEAQAFTLVDTQGKPRAALRITSDGMPSLTLNDSDAKTRVSLAVDANDEARLDLADEDEKSRASLSVTPGGEPFLAFVDQREALRAGLMLDESGAAAFILMDDEAHGRVGVGVRPDGSPGLCLVETKGDRCHGIHPVQHGVSRRPISDDEADVDLPVLSNRNAAPELSALPRVE